MHTNLSRLAGAFFVMFILTGVFAMYNSASALSGVYNYANGGTYYTRFGASQYWWKTYYKGYCGNLASSCSPAYMEHTYGGGCIYNGKNNQAMWDNIDGPEYGVHYVFIPSVNATAGNAPYTLTYNTASGYNWKVNQKAYSNVFLKTGTYKGIRNTWLSDMTCGPTSEKVGFDEIRIIY